jgi:hypothetical protein
VSNVVSYINPERHDRCQACGQNMPARALVDFHPEPDVTQWVCRDYVSCGERVMNGQEGEALPIHAATRVRKLSADIRAALKDNAGGTVHTAQLEQFGLMVEHVARVLTTYNARTGSGTGMPTRPGWASERQVAIPSAGAWRDLVHRVNALESWARNTSEYLAGPMARTEPVPTVGPDDDAPTETFPKIVP